MTTKPSYFSGIINRILMIFLLFTLAVTTGSFILRHTINKKLARLRAGLNAPSYQQGISDLLVDLDLAENSFQKATAEGTTADLAGYQHSLDTIFGRLNSIIIAYGRNGNNALPESRRKIRQGLQQKLDLSRRLFSLRKNFDSLLTATTFANIHPSPPHSAKTVTTVRADTIISTRKETSKSGLFRRLKEAIKATQAVKIVTVREKNRVQPAISDPQARQLLTQLGSEYGRLATSGQALVLANLNLLTQLRNLARQLQDIDLAAYERSRGATLQAYALATRDLNTFTGIALAAVLLFSLLLFVYIRRLGWVERRLRVESKRAIRLAGQKSEILAIMSHEIRNKLMAINGAVFTLNRSNLSDQQSQKVNTIGLASGMMLETVNNVLDAGKLEQGYAETRKRGPFEPLAAISDAMEAMRFAAENKGLQLTLDWNSDQGVIVNGDSFRLKQVLLNLLSNAIKYTETGSVHISGTLTRQVDSALLEVSVTDTGSGIPKDLQGKLFSPYYQAGGQKPGTGLGLYLCRQMIIQQDGHIGLESQENEGTRAYFSVPYQVPI